MSNTFAQNQRRWFESLANYDPDDAFKSIFTSLAPSDWALEKQQIWYVASHPSIVLQDQGWKIHVSSRTSCAADVLKLSLPFLFDRRVCFKFAADEWIIGEMNNKLWPRESSGKFITIYPEDVSTFLSIGADLTALLKGFAGPYVLSDRRWPGSRCVFYRYGGFTGRSDVTVEGLRRYLISVPGGGMSEDLRKPYFYLPPGIDDPCQVPGGVLTTGPYALKGGRYEIEKPLAFSNRGGIYRALDTEDGQFVIIKEARPLVEVGRARSSAVEVLKNEYSILQLLQETALFARPLDFFRVWEHSYLVEEQVDGVPLGEYILGYNPIYTDSVRTSAIREYLTQIASVWLEIARAIECAHSRGIVLGDLSINNVMVDDRGAVTVIDLEGARTGNAPTIGLFTPGYTKPSSWESGLTDQANDLYALGSIMFSSLAIANTFAEYYPPAMDRILDELASDLDLPSSLIDLIRVLLKEETLDGISITQVIAELKNLQAMMSVASGSISCSPRLAVSPETRFPRNDESEIRGRVKAVLDGVVDFVNNTADPSRSDRLFPAHMLVFGTNPLSVAYGACGVFHCLAGLGETVAREQFKWVIRRSISNDYYPPGLYVGQSGIAWVMDELGNTDYALSLLKQSSRHPLLWKSADMLNGAAGFGLTSLRFWHKYGHQPALDDAVRVGDWLLETALRERAGLRWAAKGEPTYIGYARGASGTALFLLYLSLATGCTRYRQAGRRAVELELEHGAWLGKRFVGFPEEPGQGSSPYWAAGTAGVLTTVLRYNAVDNDGSLAQSVRDFEADLRHKYAKFPQLFLGLAGMGNALLDLWYFSGRDLYIRQAWQIAEGVLIHAISRPEGISFPGDRALRESCDYATGATGIAMFLKRLISADLPTVVERDVLNFNFTLDEFHFSPR
jgi:serine/threonine protein kinase